MPTGSYDVSGQSNPGYVDTEHDGNQGSVVFNNNARSPADSTINGKFKKDCTHFKFDYFIAFMLIGYWYT